jgi:DNA-binding response OmpR family regulator
MSKILLIDDDVDLANLVKTKLMSEGHEVVSIHTGEGAFELAKKVKPDIALLDIMLPGATGYQICRRIRKDPELYPMAVLMLTALGDEPEVLHGLEQGADDYIVKPFKFDKLKEKLEQMDHVLASTRQRNSVTQLPGLDAIKREVSHRLARGIKIAVCDIEIAGYKAFCAVKGRDGQRTLLEFTAKLLQRVLRSIGMYEYYLAHLGGQHFAIAMNYEDHERFCNTLIQMFEAECRDLYTAEELGQGYVLASDRLGREGQYPLMRLHINIAHNQERELKSSKKAFEILSQLRGKQHPDDRSVVFSDRRKSDR